VATLIWTTFYVACNNESILLSAVLAIVVIGWLSCPSTCHALVFVLCQTDTS